MLRALGGPRNSRALPVGQSDTAGGLRYDGRMSDQPTAWQFQFRSEMTHQVRFKGTGLYATNEPHDEIFDALHLYNRGEGDELAPGEEAFIVFSHTLRKVGSPAGSVG